MENPFPTEEQIMGINLVKWIETPGKNVHGEDCSFPFPDLLDSASHWRLIEKIFNMKPQRPIKFEEAALLAYKEYQALSNLNRHGIGPGQAEWYAKNFVEWISSLGFHIELTGDEFEHFFVGVPSV